MCAALSGQQLLPDAHQQLQGDTIQAATSAAAAGGATVVQAAVEQVYAPESWHAHQQECKTGAFFADQGTFLA
jgi:hypothetical protein